MILRIGRRSDSGRRWAASLPHATATCPSSSTPLEQTSPAMAAATTTANSPRPSLSRSLSCYFSRGFASQPAAVAPDDSCDNQPGFDEDEEVTVNTWLQDYRRGVLQPRVVPFQVSVEEAKREFERWHASSWLSPTGLLKGAVASPGLPPDSATAAAAAAASTAAAKAKAAKAAASAAAAGDSSEKESASNSSYYYSSTPPPPTINAVLLPFWLFETAVHVDFRAKVLVSGSDASEPSSSRDTSNASASSSSPASHSAGWRDTGWRPRGYREYPWTLSACQVCASYGVRRDLAKAAAVPGVLGRSRPLKQWEAAAGRAVDVGWAGSCGASGGGGGGLRNRTSSSPPPSQHADPNDSSDFPYSFSAFSAAAATATGDSGAPLAPRDMRQSVAWALALRSIRKSEAESARRLLEREGKAARSEAPPSPSSSSSSSSSHSSSRAARDHHTPTSESSSSSSSSVSGSEETVRDVRVRLRPLKRRARVVYLPAYVLTYSLGERIGPEGARYPATFQALVSGLDAASVAGERHLSPLKVQAVAGLGAAGIALVAGMWSGGGGGGGGVSSPSPSSVLAAVSLDPASLAFWSFLAVAAGGVAARAATHLMREAEEAERLRAEEEAFERAAAAGLGPTAGVAAAAADFASSSVWSYNEEDLAAAAAEREAGEWRRWEEADRWSWDAGARAAWADALVREQARRRLDARRLREQVAAAVKAAADVAAEGRRRERFGIGGGGSPEGGDSRGSFSWASSSSSWPAGRDHLGYYRALGLSPADSPSPEAVKLAFRSAAFRLHPDRVASQRRREGEEARQRQHHGHPSQHPQHHQQQHHLGDAPGRARAAARFARVRAAYEVLRDPERRADYDRGGSGSENIEGGSGRRRHRRWY